MLTLQDCIDFIELNEDEIAAIAEHEHIPTIIAMEFGNYLIESPEGVPMLRGMILDDIAHARGRGDQAHAAKLMLVMQHFIETHPENE